MAEALRGLAAALREAMRKPPSEAVLLDHYARLCLVADEVVHEVSSELLLVCCCIQLLQQVAATNVMAIFTEASKFLLRHISKYYSEGQVCQDLVPSCRQIWLCVM